MASSPLNVFADLPVRFVYRPTSTYHAILRAAATRPCLREGLDRSIALEALARAYLQSAGRPAAWPVLAFEMAALERLMAGQWKKGGIPDKWDGRAAERIVAELGRLLGEDR